MDLCMQFALCLEMCQPQDASMFDYRYVRRRLNCLCIHEQRWVEAFVAAQKMLMQDVLGSHLIGCVVKRSGFEILKCHKSWYSYAFFASGKTINMTPEVCPDSPYYWEDLGHVVRAWTLRPAQGRQNGREEIDQLVACLFVERHVRLIWHDGSVISKRELSVVMSSRSVKKVLTGCSGLKVQKQVISRCRACNMQRSRLFDREMIACKQWCGQFDIDEKAIGSCREMSRLVGNEGQPKYSRLVGNIGQPKHRQVALSLQVECTVCVNLEDVEVQVQDRSASCGCLLCRMRCDVIQGIVIGRHKQMCCCAFPEREYHRYAHEKTMLLPLGGVTTRWLLHMQTKLHRCVELPLGGVTMRWLLRAVFEPGVQETLMSCDEMCRPHRMRVVLARQVDSCEDVVKFERNRMVEPRYGHVEKATWQSMLSGWDVKGVVSVIHLGYGTHVISGIFTEIQMVFGSVMMKLIFVGDLRVPTSHVCQRAHYRMQRLTRQSLYAQFDSADLERDPMQLEKVFRDLSAKVLRPTHVERYLSPFIVQLRQLINRENSFRWHVSCQCFKLGVIKMEVGSRNTTRAKENPIGMSDVAAEKVRTRDL